jgi:hypothetical protein
MCLEQLNDWYETYQTACVAQRKVVWANKIVVTTVKFADIRPISKTYKKRKTVT